MHLLRYRAIHRTSPRSGVLALLFTTVCLCASAPLPSAAKATGIVSIRVGAGPTLLAIDPHSHAVYVRTLGVVDRYDNPGKGAGYTELDGTTGRVVHVWPDIDEDAPPVVAFSRTDNGLQGLVVPHPKQAQALSPALTAMMAQTGVFGDVITDQLGKYVAIFTAKQGPSGINSYLYKLWVFDARNTHLLGSAKLPEQWVSIAFDAAANRVLVAYADVAQLFTLTGLHYLARITHPFYLEAPQIAGYANRFYDSEPVAIDTSLGRAVLISDPDTLGQGTAQIIDMATGRVLRTLIVGSQPTAVQTDTALHRAYILAAKSCEVDIVDLRSEKQVATVAVAGGPMDLAVNQATGKVFVSVFQSATEGLVSMFPATTTVQQTGC